MTIVGFAKLDKQKLIDIARQVGCRASEDESKATLARRLLAFIEEIPPGDPRLTKRARVWYLAARRAAEQECREKTQSE